MVHLGLLPRLLRVTQDTRLGVLEYRCLASGAIGLVVLSLDQVMGQLGIELLPV